MINEKEYSILLSESKKVFRRGRFSTTATHIDIAHDVIISFPQHNIEKLIGELSGSFATDNYKNRICSLSPELIIRNKDMAIICNRKKSFENRETRKKIVPKFTPEINAKIRKINEAIRRKYCFTFPKEIILSRIENTKVA